MRKERIKNQEEGVKEKKEPLIGRMMKEEGKYTFEHVKVDSSLNPAKIVFCYHFV